MTTLFLCNRLVFKLLTSEKPLAEKRIASSFFDRLDGSLETGRGVLLVHFAPSADEPFEIELGIMLGNAAYEIIAGLVPSGQNVGNAGARDFDRIGELCLRDIFR